MPIRECGHVWSSKAAAPGVKERPMPRGANAKREREYEELVDEFHEEGRYKGREEEVAARIVNKQRTETGETKTAREEDRHGRSPDRGLPIAGYEHLTVDQVAAQLPKLSPAERKKIREFETSHRNRKTLLEQLNRLD